MNKLKILKIVSNIVYGIGVAIFVVLAVVYILGANYVLYPDAMLPSTVSEIAFIGVAVGAFPMTVMSIAVYRLNGIKEKANKKLYRIIIFFPSIVCGGCFLFLVGLGVFVYIKALTEHISFMQGWNNM